MGSRFADRLDFLMSLTNTTNSALARELLFDPSYISRIRSGKRGAPLHQPFIGPAALYLAKRIQEPYQKQAAENALNLFGSWPDSHEDAARRIERWLRDDTAMLNVQFNKLFERMPQELSPSQRNLLLNAYSKKPPDNTQMRSITNTCYMGENGKRAAVSFLMSALLEDPDANMLCLYSDEDRSWLINDPEFYRSWIDALTRFARRGGSIFSIQSTIRNDEEILNAVSNWVPLYFTGHVESYYCPKLRHGACHRTLFIVPGKMVLSSNSVMNQTESMINAISTDEAAITAGKIEFDNLLRYSQSYVKSSVLGDEEAVNALLTEFFSERGPLTVVRNDDVDAIARILGSSIPASTKCIIGRALEDASRISSPVMPDHIAMATKGDRAFAIMNLSKPRGLMIVTEAGMASALKQFLQTVPS